MALLYADEKFRAQVVVDVRLLVHDVSTRSPLAASSYLAFDDLIAAKESRLSS